MNSLISHILEEVDYPSNPYFRSLADGTFSKEDFLETQIQFHSAVVFFVRPMAALAARIPAASGRAVILRNVWEEQGEGDVNRAHGATFLSFLERLGGIRAEDVTRRALWPEVRIFNTVLMGACTCDDYVLGVAALGMVERMFSDISHRIGTSVLERGWLRPDQMVHYKLHEELDVRHARDFFDLLREPWDESVGKRQLIEQGLRMGAVAFNGLYLGLYENRGLRRAQGL